MNPKQVVSDHGGKVVHGLNAAAILFLFSTFATLNHVNREIDRERQCCKEATAQRWQDAMDMFEVKGRHGRVSPYLPVTNETVRVSE